MKHAVKLTALVIVWSISVLIIATSVLSLVNLNNAKTENILDIGQNWKSGLISSFEPCSENSQDILFSSWEGNKIGCYCFITNSIKFGHCLQHDISDITLCSTINSQDKIKLVTWKGVEMCAKTYGNYFTLELASDKESCPSGTRSCGIIDSVLNKLCVPVREECPVTEIKFTESKPEGVASVKGKDSYLSFTKAELGDDKNIPIQFRASEGQICADLEHRSYLRTLHRLETFALEPTCKNKIATNLFSPYYSEVDKLSTYDLYEENRVLPAFENLRNYEMDQLKVDTRLFSRAYVGIRKDCFENFKNTSVFNDLINAVEESESASALGIAVVVCNCVLFVFIGFYLFLEAKLDEFERGKWKSAMLYALISVTFYAMIVLILVLFFSSKIKELDVSIAGIGHSGCSDAITNETLIHFEDTVTASEPFTLTTMFGLGTIILAKIGLGVTIFFTSR